MSLAIALFTISLGSAILGFLVVNTLDDDGILTKIYLCILCAIVFLIGIVYLPYTFFSLSNVF